MDGKIHQGVNSMHPDALISDLSTIVRDHYAHVIETMSSLIDRC